jgi:hypothetical protein
MVSRRVASAPKEHALPFESYQRVEGILEMGMACPGKLSRVSEGILVTVVKHAA